MLLEAREKNTHDANYEMEMLILKEKIQRNLNIRESL